MDGPTIATDRVRALTVLFSSSTDQRRWWRQRAWMIETTDTIDILFRKDRDGEKRGEKGSEGDRLEDQSFPASKPGHLSFDGRNAEALSWSCWGEGDFLCRRFSWTKALKRSMSFELPFLLCLNCLHYMALVSTQRQTYTNALTHSCLFNI